MKEELAKIRRALSRQDIVPEFTQYLIKDGTISAYDGRMVASCPIDYDKMFLVPGREFESLLDRLPASDYDITLTDDAVTIRSGRLHGRIRLLPPATATYPQPSGNWREPPAGLLEALQQIRPFISDNAIHAWALCVSLEFNLMRATTNVSLVEVDCFDLDGTGQLLPCWAIDYILSRKEKLESVQFYAEYAAFRWDDGSWMRTQLIQGKFPTQARELFQNFVAPAWRIPDEWKNAYSVVTELAESEIEIRADKIIGCRGVGTSEFATPMTPVPEEGFARFDPKFLDPVIDAATHWDPSAYPNPTPFTAPGLRGIIVGRR